MAKRSKQPEFLLPGLIAPVDGSDPPADEETDGDDTEGTKKKKKRKKPLSGLPFPPLQMLNTDNPVELCAIEAALAKTPERPNGQMAVSIIVRSADAPGRHPNRGGYFFHIAQSDGDPRRFQLFDFEAHLIEVFEGERLVRFINHCSGLEFDEEMLKLCQEKINFRVDG